MGIIKINVGHCVGKYDPWYLITPYLLTGIGPQQLGVVLVFLLVILITILELSAIKDYLDVSRLAIVFQTSFV